MYIDSFLHYLTNECGKIFKSLIRCDYLLERNQVKQVREQEKAIKMNL